MTKMSNDERRQALAPGLPRCLDGLEKLEKPLYLNRQSRRRILKTDFVRLRVRDLEPANNRPGARDRALMLAFYGNPKIRRELWRLHRTQPEPEETRPGPRRQSERDLSPPSLEHAILRDYIDENPAEDRDPEPPESGSEEDELRPLHLEVRKRLGEWPTLDDEVRIKTTQELFALATILNDQSILEDACCQVPELRDEYADLLVTADHAVPDEASAPTPTQRHEATPDADLVRRDKTDEQHSETTAEIEGIWSAGLRSLAALAAAAADSPADPAVLKELRQTVGELEGLEDRLRRQREVGEATEDLKSVAGTFLALIEDDSSCEAINATELERLRGTWLGIPALAPVDARAESDRLQETVNSLLEKVRQADALHRRIDKELDALRANRPTERPAIRRWEDAQDDLREQATRRRRERRVAEDALLETLAPSFQPRESSLGPEPSAPPIDPDTASPEEVANGNEVELTHVEGPSSEEARNGRPETDKDSETLGVTAKENRAPAAEAPADAPSLREPDDTRPVADHSRRFETQADQIDDRSSERDRYESPSTSRSGDIKAERDDAEPASKAEPPDWHQEARKALARALAGDPPKLAFAAQVCYLLEHLGIDAGQPRAALVEAALYASRLGRPDGELSAEFQSAVERALDAPPPDHPSTASINTEALVGFAAALPTVLLAPYSGATAMLQDLTHEGMDRLYRFAQDVAARSWEIQKAQIDAATLLGTARRQATQAHALSELLQDLEAWSNGPARIPLSYTPANKVWRALAEEGELGQLVKTIQFQGGHRSVHDLLGKLENEGDLRKIVDRLSDKTLSYRQSVDTKIFRQLRRRLDIPLELARRYLAMEALPPSRADHRKKVIDELVRTVREDGPKLRGKLERIAANPQEDRLLAAAALIAARSLVLAENLVDPQATFTRSNEPDAGQLLASDLFTFPRLRIRESGRVDGDPEIALQVLLRSQPLLLKDALATNLEKGEIATADRILDWLETETDVGEEVESWRSRIDTTKQELLGSLRDRLEEVRDHLDLAFSQGQIDQDRHADHQARLLSVERATEKERAVRFHLHQKELCRVKDELKAATEASLRKALDKARATFPDVDHPQRQRIERHIADGDLVTANELLYRPHDDSTAAQHDQVAEQPALLDAYLGIGREQLRELGADWRRLRDSAKRGKRIGPLRFDRLDHSERASATALLEAWSAIKRCRPEDQAGIESTTRELLAGIGFLDATVNVEQMGAGFADARISVAALRSRNECPVPHFGSEADGSYRLLIFFGLATAEQMLQRLQQPASKRAAIAMCVEPIGEHAHRRLTHLCRDQALSLVTLDESLLVFLAAQPGSRLAGFFACALPFTYNQPFAPRPGLVPPEMFFGRETEASQVTDLRGSCLVYGGRQLGKTALLRHVEREYANADRGRFAAWIDLKAEGIGDEHTSDVWAAVWRKLRAIGAIDEATRRPTRTKRSVDAFIEALHQRFNRMSSRTLLLLFDEADSFLRRDAMNSSRETFAESTRLKSLMDRDQSIKVVFAGLHNVLRTTTQSNHPLAHLGRPIPIRPFTEEQRYAEELLRRPLEACGYRFEPPRLATSVVARANYYPGLLQTYGAAIVNRLSRGFDRTDSPIKEIGRNLLEALQRDRELREEIRQRFEWTLQLDPRYEAIAYTIAFVCLDDPDLLSEGIEDDRILRHVRLWWPAGFKEAGRDVELFQALLEEMVELGVLRRTGHGTKGGRYSLRNPNVMALLGDGADIESRLESFERRPAPPEPGPFEIRRRHDDKGPLHRPLTLWQERRVSGQGDSKHRLSRRRNAVVFVCGLEATGIHNVGSFLRWGKEPREAPRLGHARTLADFERNLKRCLDTRGYGTTVIIVPEGEWEESWIDAAVGLLGNLRSGEKFARVVFTLDADRLISQRDAMERWLEQTGVDLVALRPWDPGFAALCLDDDPNVGAKLRDEQERALVDHAEGWPVLLDLILRRLRGDTHPSELIEAGGFETLLAENAETLRPAFGLARHDVCAILRLLQELGSATHGDLLDPEIRGLIDCDLDDDELRHVLWAAEKLRLVQTNGQGEWQVDPVVSKLL